MVAGLIYLDTGRVVRGAVRLGKGGARRTATGHRGAMSLAGLLVVTVMAVAGGLNAVKTVEVAHIRHSALVGLCDPRKVGVIISGGSDPFTTRQVNNVPA